MPKEAAAALVDWARSVHGIRRFLASIAPGNEPSTMVVTSLGFVHAGQRWDEEDGLELVFELDLEYSTKREACNTPSKSARAQY